MALRVNERQNVYVSHAYSHLVFKPKETILVLYTHFTDNIAEAHQYKYCEQLTDGQAGSPMRSLPNSEGHPLDAHPATVSPRRGPQRLCISTQHVMQAGTFSIRCLLLQAFNP